VICYAQFELEQTEKGQGLYITLKSQNFMSNYLVDRKNDLVMYSGKFYRFPVSLDIKNNLGSQTEVLEKRLAHSSDMGIEFISADGAFACTRCDFTRLFQEAKHLAMDSDPIARVEVYQERELPGISQPHVIEIGHPLVTSDTKKFCEYKPGNNGPHWFSYYWNDKKGVEFVARMQPCIVDTGLIMALVEVGTLSSYEITGVSISPDIVPYITQISPGNDAERKAIEVYDQFKKNFP
jgi:hypothetical protein